MDVYVAGSWKDRKKVKKIMEKIEKTGHSVYDWSDPKNDENSKLDIEKVMTCDAFIFVHNGIESIGKGIELGIAHTLKKSIFILNLKKPKALFMKDAIYFWKCGNERQMMTWLDNIDHWRRIQDSD
jgi:hypothetical protein